MPIWMPKDTREALGAGANHCDSRSLLFDRFPFYDRAVDEYRMASFCLFTKDGDATLDALIAATRDALAKENKPDKRQALQRKLDALKPLLPRQRDSFGETRKSHGPADLKIKAWRGWLNGPLASQFNGETILAQLQSRLMVNMAGGVMENAGLCLDRFGVPYIPGSAVKGCARRMAIAALRRWCETGTKPTDDGDPYARVCRPHNTPSGLLVDIAFVFGWVEQEWKSGSDFAWACGDGYSDHWKTACERLAATLKVPIPEKYQGQPWKGLPNFSGAVSFVAAYPHQLPAIDIELDVLTCHHPKYYRRDADMPIALDTEEPNPVVFPAVAAGVVFQFAVLPLRGKRDSLSQPDTKLHVLALEWLRWGLDTFGFGAKANAGYGWFSFGGGSTSVPETAAKIAEKSTLTEHPIIRNWQGKTVRENFRAFRPLLAAIQDDAELRRIFESIIPAAELKNLRKSNAYWQSFTAHPEGQAIFKRLGLKLT